MEKKKTAAKGRREREHFEMQARADSGGSLEKKKTTAKGRREREYLEMQERADSGGSLEKRKMKRSPKVSRNVR